MLHNTMKHIAVAYHTHWRHFWQKNCYDACSKYGTSLTSIMSYLKTKDPNSCGNCDGCDWAGISNFKVLPLAFTTLTASPFPHYHQYYWCCVTQVVEIMQYVQKVASVDLGYCIFLTIVHTEKRIKTVKLILI